MASSIGLVDYIIFALFLLISVGVGSYHAWKARKVNTKGNATANFLIGGRKMPTLPTALSLLTTFLSGITLLGAPAETYQRGMLFWLTYLAATLAFLITAIWFVPVIFRLQPISVYEYFQYRFDSRLLRVIAALMFLFNTLFFMSVVMYAPSVALAGVTSVPLWPFILVVGVASTFYTTFGGLKAVVWTDTLQAVFMYAGLFTLFIKGIIDAGGPSHIYDIAGKLGRLKVFHRINATPAQNNSVWVAFIGGIAYWGSMYGLNQMALQRYCSLRSLRDVNIVIAISIPCFLVLGTIACFLGPVILAYYYECDPIVTKQITTPDQLAILFAVDVLGAVPGLSGLFLACLFSGTLSTISGGMNSMAAVTWEDILKHYMPSSDRKAVFINKILVFIYGIVAMALAFACDSLGGIIHSFVSILGTLAGPLIGLFVLGILIPRATKLGAFVSLIISEIFAIWICVGNFVDEPYKYYVLDTNTTYNNETCPYNVTKVNKVFPAGTDLHFGDPSVFVLYRISPFAYGLIGIILVLVIGVPVSYLTPKQYRQDGQIHKALTYIGRKEPLRVREQSHTEEEIVTEENYEQYARERFRPITKYY